MEGKLIKLEESKYTLVYKEGSMVLEHNPAFDGKLSLKNCQAIENGYDLDELINRAFDNMGYHSTVTPYEEKQFKLGYMVAFREALEILGDKKFSEKDMSKAWSEGYHRKVDELNGNGLRYFDKFIQSLQQTEWDVTFNPDEKDSEGCLILKKL